MYRLFRDATRYMEGHHVKVQYVCLFVYEFNELNIQIKIKTQKKI